MTFYFKHFAARFAFCSSFCRFSWKSGVKDRNGDVKCVDVTVFDYFVNHRRINLCFRETFHVLMLASQENLPTFPLRWPDLFLLKKNWFCSLDCPRTFLLVNIAISLHLFSSSSSTVALFPAFLATLYKSIDCFPMVSTSGKITTEATREDEDHNWRRFLFPFFYVSIFAPPQTVAYLGIHGALWAGNEKQQIWLWANVAFLWHFNQHPFCSSWRPHFIWPKGIVSISVTFMFCRPLSENLY